MLRAKEKLTEEKWLNLRNEWKLLDVSTRGKDHDTGDGMIRSLLSQNLSPREIRMTLGCGIFRIRRIKKLQQNPNKTFPKSTPHHAVTELQKDAIKDHIASYETEDGFPCAHRRPRKYFVQEGLT